MKLVVDNMTLLGHSYSTPQWRMWFDQNNVYVGPPIPPGCVEAYKAYINRTGPYHFWLRRVTTLHHQWLDGVRIGKMKNYDWKVFKC